VGVRSKGDAARGWGCGWTLGGVEISRNGGGSGLGLVEGDGGVSEERELLLVVVAQEGEDGGAEVSGGARDARLLVLHITLLEDVRWDNHNCAGKEHTWIRSGLARVGNSIVACVGSVGAAEAIVTVHVGGGEGGVRGVDIHTCIVIEWGDGAVEALVLDPAEEEVALVARSVRWRADIDVSVALAVGDTGISMSGEDGAVAEHHGHLHSDSGRCVEVRRGGEQCVVGGAGAGDDAGG